MWFRLISLELCPNQHYRNIPRAFVEYMTGGATGRFLAYWHAFISAGFAFITSPELDAIAAGETVAPRRNIPKATRRFAVRLRNFLEEDSLSETCRQYLCTCINNAWSKLDKHSNRTDRSQVHFGAVRMHPVLNEAWLRENWSDDEQLNWLESAEERLREHHNLHFREPGIHATHLEGPHCDDPSV